MGRAVKWPLNRYREMPAEGFSVGAYECGWLVGLLLAESQSWNRTLWIWEFYIREEFRGRGIGRRLMEEAASRSFRLEVTRGTPRLSATAG